MEEQMSILTEFVRSSVPNWPRNLTLHQFVQHMTLDHVDLVRNRVLANHQVIGWKRLRECLCQFCG